MAGTRQTGRSGVQAMYDRYGTRLYRYLAGLTGDAVVAEDLLHDTFVRALRHGDLGARTAGWWFAIARNLAFNHLRDRRRKREQALEPERTIGRAESPPAGAIEEEERRQLHAAVEALDPAKREAVTLRYLHGLPVRETAEALGIPENTVKSRCHHGLRELRERLGRVL